MSQEDRAWPLRVRRRPGPPPARRCWSAEVAGEPRRARVLAAFPTALYLHLGRHDLVLPVLTGDALLLPTGLRLALPSAVVEWGVQAGHDVLVGDGRVRLPGRDVVSVRPWRPARVTRASSARSTSIAGAAHILGQADSSAVLRELAADLTAAGLGGRQVGRRVSALVGAGAGLTPSGDDALCGVLLALRAVGGRVPSGADAAGAVAASVRRASAATTSLSASLLSAASEGYAVPEVVRLVDEVARGDASRCGGGARASAPHRPQPPGPTSSPDWPAPSTPSSPSWPRTPDHTTPNRKEPAVPDHVELRRGAYYDSVSLMQVSRKVASAPGVEAAQVAMATDLNPDVIRGMGFAIPDEVGPNDLIVAIRGDEGRCGRGHGRPRRGPRRAQGCGIPPAASVRPRSGGPSAAPSRPRRRTSPWSPSPASTRPWRRSTPSTAGSR